MQTHKKDMGRVLAQRKGHEDTGEGSCLQAKERGLIRSKVANILILGFQPPK